MSGAKLIGRMPRPGEILGVLDAEARVALTQAKELTLPLAREEAPGGLGAALNGSVRRTSTGHRASIGTPRNKAYGDTGATGAQIVRWVNRGTGIYRRGPGPKRPITARNPLGRMTLPGGLRVRFVKGQHPNPFIARAEARAHAPVTRILRQGALAAGRRLRSLR